MTEVMVDTSAWIAFFRPAPSDVDVLIERLLDDDRVALCGVVEMELLVGVRPSERKVLVPLLGALHYMETRRQDFIRAGERLSRLRRRGITIPATDGLIAEVCARHDLRLLTLDPHFDHFADVQRVMR